MIKIADPSSATVLTENDIWQLRANHDDIWEWLIASFLLLRPLTNCDLLVTFKAHLNAIL